MSKRKFMHLLFAMLLMASLIGGNLSASAMPMNPTDESKVPHYFGPNPNWALSPLRLANVAVTLTGGGGIDAAASATVDMQTGAITGFTILNPGSGYTSEPDVGFAPVYGTTINNSASATAVIDSGVVNAVTVNPGGNGYTAPKVTFSGGDGAPQATGTAYGGVDAAFLDPAVPSYGG